LPAFPFLVTYCDEPAMYCGGANSGFSWLSSVLTAPGACGIFTHFPFKPLFQHPEIF